MNEKTVENAREFLREVIRLSEIYGVNFFCVTDGASAIRNARDAQIKWEKENGYDPDEDWNKN